MDLEGFQSQNIVLCNVGEKHTLTAKPEIKLGASCRFVSLDVAL